MSHDALGQQFSEHVETWRKIRDEVRAKNPWGFENPEDAPMCGPVSHAVAKQLGGRYVPGTYMPDPEGHDRFISEVTAGRRRYPGTYRTPEGGHEVVPVPPELEEHPHAWVEHEDHIIDVTHGQFGGEDIKVIPKSHPYSKRYLPDD